MQRAAALAFLALSAAYTLLASGLEEAARSPVPILGPRGFPLMLGLAGIAVSLVLLLASAPGAHHDRVVFAGDWRRVLALCGLMLVYAVALPRLGFMLSTAGFLAAAFRLLGERRPAMLIAVPLVTAVVLFAVLRAGLGVHLPEPLFEAARAPTPRAGAGEQLACSPRRAETSSAPTRSSRRAETSSAPTRSPRSGCRGAACLLPPNGPSRC